MPDSFFHYIERIELQFFFSGYLAVYALVYLLANQKTSGNYFSKRVLPFLPYSYALAATFYLGWWLKMLYPDYSFEHLRDSFHNPLLKIFGLAALLLWIPKLAKPLYSLSHCIVIFSLLLWDIISLRDDPDKLNNGLKIYLGSVLLHIVALTVIVVFTRFWKFVSPSPDNTHGNK